MVDKDEAGEQQVLDGQRWRTPVTEWRTCFTVLQVNPKD